MILKNHLKIFVQDTSRLSTSLTNLVPEAKPVSILELKKKLTLTLC